MSGNFLWVCTEENDHMSHNGTLQRQRDPRQKDGWQECSRRSEFALRWPELYLAPDGSLRSIGSPIARGLGLVTEDEMAVDARRSQCDCCEVSHVQCATSKQGQGEGECTTARMAASACGSAEAAINLLS